MQKERLPGKGNRSRAEALSAQTEALDQLAVARDVRRLEVAQHPLAAADQQQQPAAAGGGVLVLTRELGGVLDAARQHRDLDLGGAGVAVLGGVLGHDFLLHSSIKRHARRLLVIVARCLGAGSPRLSESAAGRTAPARLAAARPAP